MARRWSKLQKKVYQLIDDRVPLQIHCIDAGGTVGAGSLKRLGIYRVHLGRHVVWNFPQGLITPGHVYPDGGDCFSYSVSDINRVVREYIDTPKDDLLEKRFCNDRFGLTDILKAADRRLGRQRLMNYFKGRDNPLIMAIVSLRFGVTVSEHSQVKAR